MKNITLLLQYMKGTRRYYLGAILAMGFSALFSLVGPLLMQVTIDSVIGIEPVKGSPWFLWGLNRLGGIDGLRDRLWIIGVLMVSVTVLRGIFIYLRGKWSALSAESVAENIRNRVYDHMQHLSYDFHVKAETGDLIQRCTSDVETIRKFLGTQFVEIGFAIFMLAFSASVMFSIDPAMTWVALSVVPVIFLFAVIFFLKIRKAFEEADETEGKMSNTLQENLTGIRVVRAFAQEAQEMDKFDAKSGAFRDSVYRLIRLLAWYWSLSDLLCYFQIGLVLLVGIYRTSTGTMTLGTLVVFNTYITMLLWPVRQMGRVLTDMGKALVAMERIDKIMKEPAEVLYQTGGSFPVKGCIEFDRVTFAYEAGKPVLKDISFRVEPGQTVALLGATGSGKTTLMHLLARLYDYEQGSIRIDGKELKTLDKGWIRKNVGLILQETFLFAKTLKENIRLARLQASDEEVHQISRVAALSEVVRSFEKGYETLVGERGVSLSGGQKQRVAIARTLINDTPIVIFDDSLSAVDTETDAAIRQGLKERKNRATTFIISHRMSTLAEADWVLVLDQGRIAEKGTHEELMARKGIYYKIWEIQNSLEETLEESVTALAQ